MTNMKIDWWVVSSLDKVFPESAMPQNAKQEIVLKAARNESEDAQIILRAERGTIIKSAAFTLSSLEGPDEAELPHAELDAFWVWYTYVQANPPRSPDPADWIRKAPAFFPDAFIEEKEISIEQEWTQPLWVKVHVPKNIPAGIYSGTVEIRCTCIVPDDGTEEILTISVPMLIEVWPFALPNETPFLHTEWFHPELLAKYYHMPLWSDEFWMWLERVAEDMAAHKQNMILTPYQKLVDITESETGDLSFDFTRLDRWISIFQHAGVKWIEGSHLAKREHVWTSPFRWQRFPVLNESGTPRELGHLSDDEYNRYMKPILITLFDHLRNTVGLDTVVQHIADEPVSDNTASWLSLRNNLKEWVPEICIIDAVMCEDLIGNVDIRVPQIQELHADQPAHEGDELWSYVCLAPQQGHPNRFLDQASVQNRAIFWISFSMRLTGFLHWGYNYWGAWCPVTPKSILHSPWADSTAGSIYAHHRQPLPAGDPFIAYPGQDSICSSIRWEVVRKGIEDYTLLNMLEEAATSDGGKTSAGEDALHLIKRIRTELAYDSRQYTRDSAELLQARDAAGDLLAKLLS